MVDLSTNIDNYVKYKWSTYTNQKTGIGSELKKKCLSYVLRNGLFYMLQLATDDKVPIGHTFINF